MIQKIISELKLPPLLQFKNGKKVTTREGFERRREELKDILQKEIYGYLPPKPAHLKVEETGDEGERFCAGFATCRHLKFHCEINGEDATFPVHQVMPNGVEKAPVFVLISFGKELFQKYLTALEEIVQRGYGLCVIFYQDVAKDSADFRSCMAKYLCKSRRALTAPGKIAMWAWSLMRVMDYLEDLPDVDLDHVAVIGHSRLGKTALLAGAMDERFRYVISNDSGCSGAAISRNKEGESIEQICNRFPYWFCPKYKRYAGKESEMPFDQHFMLASVAPRYAYVASASEDLWAAPESEMLSCVAASEAYEKMGLVGFVCNDRLPEVGDIYHEGNIGYHLRAGLHYFSREDWNKLIAFINKKMENKK